ncbi:hypothetical protein [Brevibacillus sp. NRS-1366]|uniref:hypothetical protein n=1 Tax=Brevibacillus sp. NRS-1366 TaxID=3233899 RepID=UPI003D22D942
MGWSSMRYIPNKYNDECKRIDESLLKLLRERQTLAKNQKLFPPKDILQEWAEKYQMDVSEISWFLHSVNAGARPVIPNEFGELLTVLPLMKKEEAAGFTYLLTHVKQYQNASKVYLEINAASDSDDIGHIRPHLLLEIISDTDYYVRKSGARGSDRQIQLTFHVAPRLPDHVSEMTFALVPYSVPREAPPKEMILDQEIHFE